MTKEISLNIRSYEMFSKAKDVIKSHDDSNMDLFLRVADSQTERIDTNIQDMEAFIEELKELKSSIQSDKKEVQQARDNIVEVSPYFVPIVVIKHQDRYLESWSSRKKVQVAVEVIQQEMKNITFKDGSKVSIRGNHRNDFLVEQFVRDWKDRKETTAKSKEFAKKYNCEIERLTP